MCSQKLFHGGGLVCRDALGFLDRNRPDEDRPAHLVQLDDLLEGRLPFFLAGPALWSQKVVTIWDYNIHDKRYKQKAYAKFSQDKETMPGAKQVFNHMVAEKQHELLRVERGN